MASADRLIEIFNEAKDRPPGAERDQYLAEACRDEPALKEQVLALLQAHEGAGDFLRHAQLPQPAPVLTEEPGDQIGRYKLLEQIGEGGCGVVYMAEQETPVRRRVALKVIKLGMDTKQVIARFEAERQALAMMDHPNIAKVLEAGATETGRPFFVMELVRGIKITDFCDQNKLATTERLELFTQVCQAIQHAHQKGVIHRDIKPSNILVTLHDDVAVPKVIDFGIAKATVGQLTDKTVFTAFAQFIGTPAYMSPEQAQMSGLDVDTRADIYSLGVLLYELLTGNTPFDAKELQAAGVDEMRRKIREDEPPKPSTCLSTMQAMDLTTVAKRRHVEPPKLIHLIRGDLDWLVMKCLEKDRTRRYETANGLAMDIQRHLDNEPITARPPSRLYEFQKTVRRHKFGFAAATALIIVLGLGVLASTWQALRATRAEREQIKLREEADIERKIAQTEAAKSRQVARFMQDMLKGVGPSAALGRDTTMLRKILEQTARRLAELKGQPAVEADLRTTLGNVYLDLGEYPNAAAMYREALALRRKLFGDEHPEVATALDQVAAALSQQGRKAEAETIFREALAMRRKLLGNEHMAVSDSLDSVARIVEAKGKLVEAETLWREALALRRKLLGSDSPGVAYVLHPLAWTLNGLGNRVEAEALSREELAIWRKSVGENHPNVSWALADLTIFLREQGKLAEAETTIREALAILRNQTASNPGATIGALRQLAWVLYHQSKPAEAEGVSREALAMCRKLFGNEHPEVAATLEGLATFLEAQGKSSEVETTLRECLTIRETKLPDTWLTLHTRSLLGGNLHMQKKYTEAEPWLLSGFQGMNARKDKGSGNDRYMWEARQRLGQLYQTTGQAEKAAALWREELAALRKAHGNDSAEAANSLQHLALFLRDQGQLAEAESVARESLVIRRERLGNEHLDVAFALHLLAWTCHLQGNDAESETLSREALAIKRKRLGSEHHEVAATLYDLTVFLRDQGKLAEAEITAREASTIRQNEPSNARRDLTATLSLLADVLKREGKLTEAEAVWREELTSRRKDQGDDGLAVAHSYHQLAALLRDQRKPTEAETMIRESLAISRKLLGNEHIEVARTLDLLTYILRDQFKLAEAEATARELFALHQKLSGNANPDTAEALKNLAEALGRQGNYAEAKALFLEAAKDANAHTLNEIAFRLATAAAPKLRDGPVALILAEKAVAGTNRKDPLIVDTLAAAYAEVGQFTNAVRVQQEAIALLQDENQKPGYIERLRLYESGQPYRNHGQLAELTKALLDEQKPSEAEAVARECLALREQLIPDDWRTFNVRSLLGGSLLGQKKYTETEPLLLSGYEGMKQREDKIADAGKPRLKEAMQRLVQLYETTGQSDAVAQWSRKLAEFDRAEAEKKPAAPKP